jgi:Ni,Fe-hydrogenase I large subunit
VDLEGRLQLTVTWDGHRVRGCNVDSSRPVEAYRVLCRRPAVEALALVPRLYSLCGQAQQAAAEAALNGATGVAPEREAAVRRELAVLAEMGVEYLWRFLIDLPHALGEEPLAAPVAEARTAAAKARESDSTDPGGWAEFGALFRRVAEESVLGVPLAAWLQLSNLAGWSAWLAQGASPVARLLRRLQDDGLASWGASRVGFWRGPIDAATAGALAEQAWDEAGFAREPHWQGQVLETGPLARGCDHPLVEMLRLRYGSAIAARLAARLLELAQLVGRVEGLARGLVGARVVGSAALGPGRGAGWVETARGLLLHYAEVAGDEVRDYRIVAPTEWNFHPRGPLVTGLEGAEATDEAGLRRAVGLSVLALDPCVAYDLRVAHA